MNASSFTFYLMLLLLVPLSLVAQTLPEGARVNKDRCLGYEMEYKKYPKPVIAKVQADMYQLYHLESAWKNDAARTGKPLNDGILGPITWSWMQRFCKSFALDATGNAVTAFPQRATEIATFSKNFSDDASTLLSDPFREWVATHRSPCGLDAREILAQGNDSELQALLRCYRPAPAAELTPAPKPAPAVEISEPSPLHTLYVFRAEDFTALESDIVDAPAVAAQIDKMVGKRYSDKATAEAELTALLADLSPKESKNIIEKFSAVLRKKNRYEINDEVLNTLSQQGISDALFGELKNLLGKTFDDKTVFNNTLTIAINKSLPLEPAAPTTSEDGDAEATASAVRETVIAARPNPAKLLLQIRLASQQTYFELDKDSVEEIVSNNEPITSILVKVLTPLQDIEYPTAELIDLAIINKILKASNFCKQDKSNAEDKQSPNLEPDEQVLLAKAINKEWKINTNSDSTPVLNCSDKHEEDLRDYYKRSWRKELRKLYMEEMKEYEGKNISWDGSSENCGCVRTEIQTMAYGIYPYWKVIEEDGKIKKQIFDFSSFSRVAYFGLTANDDGALVQIKADGRTPTILDDKDDDARQFIREARHYGSKVDWIIEKEFLQGSQFKDEDAALNAFFYKLKRDVLKLLTTPLNGPESHLLPWLSFGLAAQPSNGDGVTFYFKNYPKTKIAKDAFKEFFKTLKDDLKEFDEKRDSFHAIKNHTYVNVMIDQSEFLDPESAFSRANLSILTINNYDEKESATNPEVQEQIKSMIILLLEDPYYNALDTIYAVTDGPIRSIIAPLMFTDYSGLNTAGKNGAGTQKLDEREKRLSYINESFGGGGFWPMIEYKNNSDGKNYDGFNEYIGEKFSPGYVKGSLWNETLCSYRWMLIAVMNFWLLLALTYVTSIFYLYPHRCKELPAYISWLQHPLTVVVMLLPLIVLWVYLFVVFPPLRSINLTNLMGLIVLILVIVAGIDAIKHLKKLKPNRNLLQTQKKMSVPRRMPEANNISNDELDADEEGK